MSTLTPTRGPNNPPSSYRGVQNLIATYAELVDDGDFAGGRHPVSVSGRDAIEMMLQDRLIVYDDGTPRTKHVTHQSRHRGR